MIATETFTLLEWPRLCQQLATFTATKLGAIAAQQLQPATSQAVSMTLLAETQEATHIETRPPGLKFTGIADIGTALTRAQHQGLLNGKDLLAIALTLKGARQLRRTVDAQEDAATLKALVAELRTHPDLEQAIHHCIDDRGQVADRASAKLGQIRDQLKTCRQDIYQKLQRLLQRHSGAIQEAVITQRGDRFVIPVKAPQKEAIPGIVHDASTSGATLYIEPKGVIELGNRLRQLQRQEKTEEEAVCRALTTQVAEVAEDLERLLAIVTALDLATARARYGLWLNANAPRFVSPHEQITLRQLRHPLLVWQQHHEQGAVVVPIDVVVSPTIRVVAITGPNTGGKTVTLKTLGLATLMAKAGLFIPAREPVELPWFEQVLADIGDEQSIEQSLSTFSGHIKRIGRILAAIEESKGGKECGGSPEALGEQGSEGVGEQGSEGVGAQGSEGVGEQGSNALVLLDEVGAGTDPSEGSALAIALLRHLANRARFTLATTHYGELKALKYEDERFENASVEFDDVSLSPTYRLLWGIPGRSNALTIARRLGLNSTVVDDAQALVGVGQSQDVNQVIAGLEAQRKRQEHRAKEASQLLSETEKLHQEVARKADFLKERERQLQQQQEQAVQSAVADARKEIAQVIHRLQQGDATAQAAQKATEAINTIAKRQQSKPVQKPKPGFQPKTGDRIRLLSLGQTAEVLSDPDGDGKLAVRFGLMKMTVGLEDIESLAGEKADIPKPKVVSLPPTPAPKAPAVRTSKNTFDLRGMRVAEAEAVLEEAIASSSGPIWLIHGHGTGKLKRGVQAFLKHHPQVERFELAEQSDGGSGVTIAHV
ncbi:MAG: endonuclease MutS2 [Leptolyngbyaceae cyanobacterium]